MKSPHHPLSRLSLVIALMLVLSGCSKTPAWFIGSYEFDNDAAAQAMLHPDAKAQEARHNDGFSGILSGLAAVLTPIAVSQKYSGATVQITTDEIITTKDGSGTVMKFEVHESPTPDSIMIKTSENKIETWVRTDTGIAQRTGGTVELLIPFKRKQP
jgi:uncharacterized protein YceK